MNLKVMVLKALAEHEGKPVLIPVITNMLTRNPEIVKMIKEDQIEREEVYSIPHIEMTGSMMEERLAFKVRFVMTKLVKDGLADHTNLITLRNGEMKFREDKMGYERAGRTRSQFIRLVKKIKLVFSDMSQLNICQGAYQITAKGLEEIGMKGLKPTYVPTQVQ